MDKNQLITEWAGKYNEQGISVAKMIADYYPQSIDLLSDPDLWPDIEDKQSDSVPVDIVTPKQHDWRKNTLELYSDSVRKSVKFPENTCLLQGLGCLSAAMSRHFKYIPYQGSDESRPANLFCVSGMPPSTGKSGVNNAFMNPIRIAYETINQHNAMERKKSEDKIAMLRKELKNASLGNQMEHIENDLIKESSKVKAHPDYLTDVNDSTPEGLEKLMAKQEGWANIISAEAEAIDVMLGSVYGDSSKKTNSGIFLAMWAGEWVSVQRSGRDGFKGFVRGSCAVLAQPETVASVLEAGKLGRGISERFLVINEPHILGERDHMKYIPIDGKLKAQYIDLVTNIVNSQPVTLTFSADAHRLINEYRNTIESEMGDGGKYNDSMIRGTMGKAGEQIQKIACIMWTAAEWSKGGKQRTEIGLKTTQRAIDIFDELSRTYLKAAEESGCAGVTPKTKVIIDALIRRCKTAKRSKKLPEVTVQQIHQTVKNKKEFKHTKSLTKYLRDVVMREVEDAGAVILSRGKYYINPKVMEIDD